MPNASNPGMGTRGGTACFALQRAARTLFFEAMRRCSVEAALQKLEVGEVDLFLPERATLSLRSVERLLVVAMGKGAAAMLRALLSRPDIVGGRNCTGVLVAPERPAWLPAGLQYIRGAHPIPDANSLLAAETILRLLGAEPANPATLCLFLVSGGASAMVEMPLDTVIPVEDTARFYRALVHSGAPIAAINTVRKHFSAVKGGRLGVAAGHLRTLTLLMSDVPAGCLDALGSGPTLPDSSTVEDCRRVLDRYALWPELPSAVQAYFRACVQETPKPSHVKSPHLLLLSQADLAHAAATAATDQGFHAVVDDTADDVPAAEAAEYLLARFRERKRQHGRVCLVSTGEVIVPVPPELRAEASGGRNQHFVLECATRFKTEEGRMAVLSCGSDGVDGNSTAAGGVVTSADFRSAESQARARNALDRFQSNHLLRRMGGLVETGPTGLNLRDLRVLIG